MPSLLVHLHVTVLLLLLLKGTGWAAAGGSVAPAAGIRAEETIGTGEEVTAT